MGVALGERWARNKFAEKSRFKMHFVKVLSKARVTTDQRYNFGHEIFPGSRDRFDIDHSHFHS